MNAKARAAFLIIQSSFIKSNLSVAASSRVISAIDQFCCRKVRLYEMDIHIVIVYFVPVVSDHAG